MPGFFSRKKGKDGSAKISKAQKHAIHNALPPDVPAKPQWDDAWTRKTVDPEEVQELLRGCTLELKAKALDLPFILLPFRPTSENSSAARTFIRTFFDSNERVHGDRLAQELRLTEPMVLCSVAKWCWSRLAGGVVTWEAYELFRVGEQDSNMARDAFATFIPLSVDSDARTKIIFDFFDLLSAIAAHGKLNGLAGRKLSRLAGWWAFEQVDTGNGFDGGYQAWVAAADAASHLFFAYLRSLSPDSVQGLNGISSLPMSLQKLVQETEYPPERPALMQTRTAKVAMIVDSVSPTPFALLRRANHFGYRDQDRALQDFSDYEDPVQALTEECRRVLNLISGTNESKMSTTKQSTSPRNATWSRFEDFGFAGTFDETDELDTNGRRNPPLLRTTPGSKTMNMGRPTTPSWADFLSSGFVDEPNNGPAPLLLPPDKILPPIETSRGRSSQSHRPRLENDRDLEPGELANITNFDLDDAFWWVWISSLSAEEPAERKAAFGRCALVETVIPGGKWLVMEEMVKGAAPEPAEGAYIAEKKGRFGWTKRSKTTRTRSNGQIERDRHNQSLHPGFKTAQSSVTSKTSIGPDQHARIQAAAAQLQQKQLEHEHRNGALRRGRNDTDALSQKTSSVFTLQPVIMNEASPALKWASKYDKDAIRDAYLSNSDTGRGIAQAAMGQPQVPLKSKGNVQPDEPRLNGGRRGRRDPSPENRSSPNLPPPQPEKAEPETKPIVPAKAQSPPLPPAPLPPTPNPGEDVEIIPLSEKSAEVELPQDPHPVERKPVPVQAVQIPTTNIEGPPPEIERQRTASSDQPEEHAAGDKHSKLQKKSGGGGGFRKMFGRGTNKNRQSMLPETLNGNNKSQPGQLQPGGASLGRRFSGFRKKSPMPSPTNEIVPVISHTEPAMDESDITPVQSPAPGQAKAYEPSTRTSLSRVNTNEAHEAHQAFSSFDQGPLDDVPAFVPEYPEVPSGHGEDTDALPEESQISAPGSAEGDEHEPTKQISLVQVQDRWAQNRKNAVERAAHKQSEEQSRGGQSFATDNDSERSGDETIETIESRVARIKQRVAELTGNMESSGPSPNGSARRV
ncbi:MAG: hypothetical protein M1818_001922 [Claussenomyces sp. TS43310]|nr:MAG: hypothetical protein M1818_001922 [Claussenomyces sp. TS43310]